VIDNEKFAGVAAWFRKNKASSKRGYLSE